MLPAGRTLRARCFAAVHLAPLGSIVALADQISREFKVSDQGIDMEIEFNDDAHEATGAKLQLKSGDSYTRKRRGDDVKKSGQPGAPEFSFARSNWRLIVNGNNASAESRGVSAPSGLVMFSISEGGQI